MSSPIIVEDPLSASTAAAKVIRGSFWRIGGNLVGILAGIGTATLMLRHLGVVQSGRYVTVLSLVAIASSVVDIGLNVSASRDLALRSPHTRGQLMADVIAQRLWTGPLAVGGIVTFSALAGYPSYMVIGGALAGTGLLVMALADALLLPLTIELRNAGLGVIDALKQLVTLACVALLVALGARLTPFFAVLIASGLAVLAAVPMLAGGRRALVRPRLDFERQRMLLRRALPIATALLLGQVYFRLVILLMSLISSGRQTGYFGGSLRAMETLLSIPVLVAGAALPMLAAAGRDDHDRLRRAVEGLSKGAIIAGILVVLVTIRAAEPAMSAIGGANFIPSGAVLRIQVGALAFGALAQIWSITLLALDRQHELVLTNTLALLGLAVAAAALVPTFGATGGAAATVIGDALLAALVLRRLRHNGLHLILTARFLGQLATAAAAAVIIILLPGLPNLLAAALAGATFLGIGQLIGMLPTELHDALGLRHPGRPRT